MADTAAVERETYSYVDCTHIQEHWFHCLQKLMACWLLYFRHVTQL